MKREEKNDSEIEGKKNKQAKENTSAFVSNKKKWMGFFLFQQQQANIYLRKYTNIVSIQYTHT